MERCSSAFPSPEEGLALHLRLLEHDPVAPSDLCDGYLRPLVAALENELIFRHVDPHLPQEAAEEALINYLKTPQKYNPAQRQLDKYLYRAARCDLLNLWRRERRHEHIPWSAVELGPEVGNVWGREKEPAAAIEEREEAEWQEAWLRSLEASFSAPERRVLRLMLTGERSQAAFAEALGITALAPAEQELHVKRAKDRIKKRLQRESAKHE
jgi:RNA polymerase sigma factor (sigma-70 family)